MAKNQTPSVHPEPDPTKDAGLGNPLADVAVDETRAVHGHEKSPVDENVRITAGSPGPGGAPHEYTLEYGDETTVLVFQHGPVPEVGVNGLTLETLLTVVDDVLDHFQAGPFACQENEGAMYHVRLARHALHLRTAKRESRGVEGKLEA